MIHIPQGDRPVVVGHVEARRWWNERWFFYV